MRPYPWKCGECKQRAVVSAVAPYTAMMKHENTMHTVTVSDLPVHRCGCCGAIAMGEEADARIRARLRDDLGLLQPDVIRARRKARGLTQDELGQILGFAEASVSRWEGGAVQSKATDNLLRSFFDIPAARRYMTERACAKALVTVDLGEVVEHWPGPTINAATWVHLLPADAEPFAGNSNHAQAA